MSLTKLWLFTIKPPHTASSSAFTNLWQEVLQFCRARTHAQPATNHTLWQDTAEPSRIIMLSGYPSQEATDSADAEYVKTYAPRMAELVAHDALYQLAVGVGNLPIEADTLVVRVTEGGGSTNANMKRDMSSDSGGDVVGEFRGEDKVDARKPLEERKGVYVRLIGVQGADVSHWLGGDGDACRTYTFRKLSL